MKKVLLLLVLFCFHLVSFGQKQLVKDLDGDAKMDTVSINTESSKIICRLSTQKFKKTESKAVDVLNEESGIAATKNGFSFSNNWMRAGYSVAFRYDKMARKMQVIGMNRYEFGNATNDGSGESSVNLLTNDYIGNWNYWDEEKEELVKLPTIKTKMNLGKVYLEGFNDEVYFTYADKCAELYGKQKDKAQQ